MCNVPSRKMVEYWAKKLDNTGNHENQNKGKGGPKNLALFTEGPGGSPGRELQFKERCEETH